MIGEQELRRTPIQWVGLRLRALRPAQALPILIVSYVLFLTAGMAFKYTFWGQGFDHVDYEQAIWNTTQGRPFEISRYNFTNSILGMDFMPGLLFAVPFYLVWPSAYMLALLQSVLLALGALPVYLIARDHFSRQVAPEWGQRAGLGWAALYLLYPTLQFVNMTPPWQPRTLAILLLLWAFRFFQQGRALAFFLALLAAITTRTDVSLVVLAFGLYTLVSRRNWRWFAPPLILGLAWFYLSISVLTPSFYDPGYQPDSGAVNIDPSAGYTWPGPSAQIGYYSHLGKDPVDIVKNILTHPREVAILIFTPEKMLYLFMMVATLLFLPLLAPKELLLTAPIFAINLLSTRIYQYTIKEQYQALIIPGIVIAGIYGSARLWRWLEARRPSAISRWLGPALLVQIVLLGAIHIAVHNPVIVAFRHHETYARVALMERMAGMIPRDASVAATSFLAPRLLPREHLYYLPPGPMHPSVDQADYAFIDTRAAVLEDKDLLQQLRGDPRWQVVQEEDDLVLFKQRGR
jgi:uncharacterized membrane protein